MIISMKITKIAAITALLLGSALISHAQEFGQSRYSIAAEGVYGYNGSWQHHGGADIKAFLPVHKNVQLEAGAEVLSPKEISTFATIRPVLPVGHGELFMDLSMNFRPYLLYSDYDLNAGASFGYRQDYISAQVGVSGHWMGILHNAGNNGTPNNNTNATLTEPWMVMYRIRACVRPHTSSWNIGGGLCNYNEFVWERFWQPLFFVDAHCDIAKHLRVQASAYIKPAGIFHQVATFNEITVRAGLTYIF